MQSNRIIPFQRELGRLHLPAASGGARPAASSGLERAAIAASRHLRAVAPTRLDGRPKPVRRLAISACGCEAASISVHGGDRRARLLVTGELDLATRTEFQDAMASLSSRRLRAVVLDLSGLDFMDVSTMRALLRYADYARKQRIRLSVILGRGEPRRLLEVCGALSLLDVRDA